MIIEKPLENSVLSMVTEKNKMALTLRRKLSALREASPGKCLLFSNGSLKFKHGRLERRLSG